MISDYYKEQNAKLHKTNKYGKWGYREAENVTTIKEKYNCDSVLDFGSGACSLSKAVTFPITNFDPAIKGIDVLPEGRFDLVVCFPAGTHIRGCEKPIEDIQVGDVVYGMNNQEQEVVTKYEHSYSGKMYSVKVTSLPVFNVTAEHPILVSDVKRVHRKNNFSHEKSAYEYVKYTDSWKEAKDLGKGDWVSLPRETEVSNFYFSFEIGRGKKVSNRLLNKEISWFLGLYAGDGCSCFSEKGAGVGLVFLGWHEKHIAERAKKCLFDIGVHSSIDDSRDKNMRILRFSCVDLCRRLCEWCGVHSKNKKVPEQVLKSDESVVRGFIEGLVDSDGCIREARGDKYYSVSTISTNLAYGLVEMLHKIGVGCRLYWEKPSKYNIQGRTGNSSGTYTISWQYRVYHGIEQNGFIPYSACRFIGDRVYLKVNSVIEYDVESEVVYNIETEDNTYNIPITVHNCSDVMEHIEPEYLEEVLQTIQDKTNKVAYFVIATSLDGTKTLPDGRDPHLIVQEPEWWVWKLSKYFTVKRAESHNKRSAVRIQCTL